MMKSRFNNVRDTEGRLIAALDSAELAKLEQRCARHIAALEAKGLQQQPPHVTICAAVAHEINRRAAGSATIAEAFSEFSELRRQCIAAGYAVPPLVGTPSRAAIDDVCALLRDALRCAEPLPGETPATTARITESYREEITAAIAEINAPALARTERPF